MNVVKIAQGLSPVVKRQSHNGVGTASRRPANNSSYASNTSSGSYTSNLLDVAESVGMFLATKNPYIAGAVVAYEGYKLVKDYFSEDGNSSSSGSSNFSDSSSSSGSSSFSPVVKVPSNDSSSSSDYLSTVEHISSSVRSGIHSHLSKGSSNGSTLLDVLRENNVSSNKVNAGLMSGLIDAVGIAGNHNSVALEKSAQMQMQSINALNSNLTAVLGDIAFNLSSLNKTISPYFSYETFMRTQNDVIVRNSLRTTLAQNKDWDFYPKEVIRDESFSPVKEDPVVDSSIGSSIDDADIETLSPIEQISRELGVMSGYLETGFSDLTSQFESTKQKDDLVIDDLEFRSSSQTILDLDDNEICNVSPRDVENIKNATVARKVTDENNFELDDDDFDDDFNSLMPDISAIFGSYNVSDIITDITKSGGSE